MSAFQPKKSAETLNKKVHKHLVYIGSGAPTFVSEYKDNFTWPPLSAYPTLKPIEKSPTQEILPPTLEEEVEPAAAAQTSRTTTETIETAESFDKGTKLGLYWTVTLRMILTFVSVNRT